MFNMQVPSWDEAWNTLRRPEHNFAGKLLSTYPWVAEPGNVTVFCSDSECLLSAVGWYLIEQLTLDESAPAGEGSVVFSFRKDSWEYLRDMALSRAGVDHWRINRGLLAMEDRTRYAECYEKMKAEIDAANIHVFDAVGMTMEDLDDAMQSIEYPMCLDLALIDSLLDCRCRGSDASVLGWSLVSNRLSRFARVWRIPVVALLPIPQSQLCKPYQIFEGFGTLDTQVNQAFIVHDAGRIDYATKAIRRIAFNAFAGRMLGEPIAMEFDREARWLYDEGVFSSIDRAGEKPG